MLHCTKEIPVNLRIENSISEIAQKARGRYEDAVKGARQSTEKAAGRVSKGKKRHPQSHNFPDHPPGHTAY